MQQLRLVNNGLRTATLVLALVAGVLIVNPASAQYKPTGEDGITASPRLREQLNERKARPTQVAIRSTMTCEKCKDTWVSQRITESKGAGSRAMTGNTTKLVAKHLGDGCGTEWKVAGTGKAKQLVATHTCSESGSENLACCTGASPTKDTKNTSGTPVK